MAGYKPELVFQPYIAPQQALPVEEFNNLGTVLNERYDKNIAKWDELDAYTNQLQLNEQDSGIKNSALSDTRNILKEIRENGNWENARLQVREVAKRLANDPAIMLAQQNFKRSQEQRDTESKMKMQGHTLVDFNLGRFNQSTIDPTTGKARLLNYDSTEKLQDYDARRKSIFEGMTADGYNNKGSNPTKPDPITGAIYQIGTGDSATYINAKKVKEIAARNLDGYLDSEQGQQEYRVLTSRNSMNGEPMDAKQAKQTILDRLTNTGLTRVFSQTGHERTTTYSGSLGGSANSGKESPNDGNPNVEGSTIERNVVNPALVNIADKLDSTKKRDTSTMLGGDLALMPGTTIGRVALNKDEQRVADKIGIALGIKKGAQGYSNSQLQAIQQYAKDKSNTGVSFGIKAFTGPEIDERKKYMLNGAYYNTDKKFYDRKANQFYTFDQLPDKNQETLKGGKGDVQFTGVLDPDNPFGDLAKKKYKEKSGWISPEAITINGNQYIVSSSLSDRSKKDLPFRELIQTVSRPGRTGEPMYISDGKTKELIVPSRQGFYQLKDTNGKLIHKGEFTKEEIADYVRTYNLTPEEQ